MCGQLFAPAALPPHKDPPSYLVMMPIAQSLNQLSSWLLMYIMVEVKINFGKMSSYTTLLEFDSSLESDFSFQYGLLGTI
jgi:hypothetical protein